MAITKPVAKGNPCVGCTIRLRKDCLSSAVSGNDACSVFMRRETLDDFYICSHHRLYTSHRWERGASDTTVRVTYLIEGWRSWGWGLGTLKICRRGQSMFCPPPKISHSFIQVCCWITLQVSHHQGWKTCVKSGRYKTNFSRRLKQFYGLDSLTLTPFLTTDLHHCLVISSSHCLLLVCMQSGSGRFIQNRRWSTKWRALSRWTFVCIAWPTVRCHRSVTRTTTVPLTRRVSSTPTTLHWSPTRATSSRTTTGPGGVRPSAPSSKVHSARPTQEETRRLEWV